MGSLLNTQLSSSLRVVSQATTSTPSGNWFGILILGPYPRPTEVQTLEVEPSNLGFKSAAPTPPGVSGTCLSLGSIALIPPALWECREAHQNTGEVCSSRELFSERWRDRGSSLCLLWKFLLAWETDSSQCRSVGLVITWPCFPSGHSHLGR